MKLALALDVGTTSLGAVALDSEGRVHARVQRPNPAHRAGLPQGRAEQEPEALFEAALEALRSLAGSLGGEPLVLGLTGQMHGVLLSGPANRPLTPLISWQDRRATEPTAGGRTVLETFFERCPAEALESLGCRPAPGFGGVTLHVLREREELPPPPWRAVTAADWVGAKLTGAEPKIDPSNAASLGLFDVVEGRWSGAMLSALGLESDRLPDVVESGAALGGLTPGAARATGLPPGMPVVAAIGDNQAAVLGSLPAGDDALQINIGTGGQVSWPVPGFVRVEGMETRPLPAGRLMLVGAGVSGGDAYAWVERTVSAWLSAFGVGREPEEIYGRLAELASALPEHNDGLRSRPVFRGTRRRPAERGAFEGVTFENFTPGHAAQAVLHGIAAGLHEFVETAGAYAPRASRIIATGNAVRRNPLLVRALESRFELPVWTPEHEEEAAYGAALLAGAAAGMWRDLAEAGAAMRLRPASGSGRELSLDGSPSGSARPQSRPPAAPADGRRP